MRHRHLLFLIAGALLSASCATAPKKTPPQVIIDFTAWNVPVMLNATDEALTGNAFEFDAGISTNVSSSSSSHTSYSGGKATTATVTTTTVTNAVTDDPLNKQAQILLMNNPRSLYLSAAAWTFAYKSLFSSTQWSYDLSAAIDYLR